MAVVEKLIRIIRPKNTKNVKVMPKYETRDRLSNLFYELWTYSHHSWKLLKRTSPEEIDENFLDSLLGDELVTLQIIKTYEKERSENRYKYILDVEDVLSSVKEKIKERKTYSPKELIAELLPWFIGLNDMAESQFIWSFKIKPNEIQRLKNLLKEKIDKNIDDAVEKRIPGLPGIDISKKYFTYLLLDLYDSLPQDKILDGHYILWNKIKNRTRDFENAIGDVVRLGKYGHLREAHYPYVLYTVLSNLERGSSVVVV